MKIKQSPLGLSPLIEVYWAISVFPEKTPSPQSILPAGTWGSPPSYMRSFSYAVASTISINCPRDQPGEWDHSPPISFPYRIREWILLFRTPPSLPGLWAFRPSVIHLDNDSQMALFLFLWPSHFFCYQSWWSRIHVANQTNSLASHSLLSALNDLSLLIHGSQPLISLKAERIIWKSC